MELCPGSSLGSGFQLQIGLAEIHVPRMWVEEDDNGHHVSRRAMSVPQQGVESLGVASLCVCAVGVHADILS